MSRIAYVNGRYVPHRDAAVHIEDRGYQFGDGVYEVILVQGGRLVDEDLHFARLERSLRELRIGWPVAPRSLGIIMHETIRRNGVRDGIVYVQVTRGVAPRDHAFPARSDSALVVTSRRSRAAAAKAGEEGVRVITIPDIRWGRCDIKSIGLLPNVLGKQAAREAGAYEAWQVDTDGMVTEGTSSNAWIVTPDGELVTRQADNAILNGCTRLAIIDIAGRHGLRLVERPFSLAEAKAAREAFVSSTTSLVTPVVQIDDAVIANGHPGTVSRALRQSYIEHARQGGPGPV
jgi:D-alanine transaminase